MGDLYSRHFGKTAPKKVVSATLRNAVTKLSKPVTKRKTGRPKQHASDADRQRAYRERKANGKAHQ